MWLRYGTLRLFVERRDLRSEVRSNLLISRVSDLLLLSQVMLHILSQLEDAVQPTLNLCREGCWVLRYVWQRPELNEATDTHGGLRGQSRAEGGCDGWSGSSKCAANGTGETKTPALNHRSFSCEHALEERIARGSDTLERSAKAVGSIEQP
ncbi:hypothetical protein ACN6K4_002327 [Streptomyces hayashii]|uniref:hypothetical protein n=1 Tax=Streptomyces hayashii TaxID=2839966 RepID=UPI00403D48FF